MFMYPYKVSITDLSHYRIIRLSNDIIHFIKMK